MNRLLAICMILLLALAVISAHSQPPPAPWKFAMVCDCRGGKTGEQGSEDGVRTSVLRPIAAAIAADGADLVLFPGDETGGKLDYGPLATQLKRWRETMKVLYDAHIPVYCLRGNHETALVEPNQGDSAAQWREVMGDLPQDGPPGEEGLTYRVDHNNATFVGFDQYVNRASTFDPAQYDSTINMGFVSPWVIEQIESPDNKPWVFVFGHETAFIEHHTDCLANSPAERDALWDALGAAHGVYLCGHDHMYVRRHVPDSAGNPVTELVVGSGGAPFYARDNEGQHDDREQPAGRGVEYFNGALNKGVNENTGGRPPYFGYLLITVNGNTAIGEWKAFTNYDCEHWAAPANPRFETLDRFTLSNGR